MHKKGIIDLELLKIFAADLGYEPTEELLNATEEEIKSFDGSTEPKE
ncbi:MAG: hypothetical protein K5765_06040 [Clostridia bacterium]|nr:hypothetical protein [Clostridia bacterium]